jgi:hypothetical protein
MAFIVGYHDMIACLKKKALSPFELEKDKEKAKKKIKHYQGIYNYRNGAMLSFFIKGIKPQYLKTFSGRYHRFLLIFKLVLNEILIVSLQMLPRTQIALLTLLQVIMFIVLLKGFFIDKIYSHCLFGVSDLMMETTFLVLFVIGFASEFFLGDQVDKGSWMKAQVICLNMILVTALVNILQMAWNAILGIQRILDERKYRVSNKSKEKEGKKRKVNKMNWERDFNDKRRTSILKSDADEDGTENTLKNLEEHKAKKLEDSVMMKLNSEDGEVEDGNVKEAVVKREIIIKTNKNDKRIKFEGRRRNRRRRFNFGNIGV